MSRSRWLAVLPLATLAVPAFAQGGSSMIATAACRNQVDPELRRTYDQVEQVHVGRKHYVDSVRTMGEADLRVELRRLSQMLEARQFDNAPSDNNSWQDLTARRELVQDALRREQLGLGRLDPENNAYASRVAEAANESRMFQNSYDTAVNNCLEQRGARQTQQRAAGYSSFVPRAAPGAIEKCRGQVDPQTRRVQEETEQIYDVRRNYVNQVARMSDADLVMEQRRLSHMLTTARTNRTGATENNSREELNARLDLVIEAQEKSVLGGSIDPSSNAYSSYVEDGRRQAQQFQEVYEAEVARCLQKEAAPRAPARIAVDDHGDATPPSPAASRNPRGPGGPRDWMTGTFDTGGGVMVLTPGGGTYQYSNGRLSSITIDGAVMEGIWTQDASGQQCRDGGYHGRFRLVFTETGFNGLFGYCDEPPAAQGGFYGTRRRE